MPELTDEQIAQIRGRCERATPGPWARYGFIGSGLSRVHVAAGKDRAGRELFVDVLPNYENAAFIARARQDVPDLLAEVERLRTRVAELEARTLTGRKEPSNQTVVWRKPGVESPTDLNQFGD